LFAVGVFLTVPLSHAKLAVFYRQWAQQLSAGLTLVQALRAPSPAPAGDCGRLATMLEAGLSWPEVLAAAGSWLPMADRPFLRSASASGRLPRVLAKLADRHAQISSTQRRVVFASLYPLGVFHFGAVVLPFLRLIDFEKGLNWSLSAYLGGLACVLVPVWGMGLVLYGMVKRGHPLALGFLNVLPAIGGYRRQQSLADFAFALGNLLEAGAPIGSAWRDAGEISRASCLRVAAGKVVEQIELGLQPGRFLVQTKVFPAEFITRYQIGESTGGLEAALLALATDHQERANERLTVVTVLYPALLFVAVAGLIGYLVIGFALRYYNMLNGMMENM